MAVSFNAITLVRHHIETSDTPFAQICTSARAKLGEDFGDAEMQEAINELDQRMKNGERWPSATHAISAGLKVVKKTKKTTK